MALGAVVNARTAQPCFACDFSYTEGEERWAFTQIQAFLQSVCNMFVK